MLCIHTHSICIIITNIFHTMCRVRKLKALSQNQKHDEIKKSYRNDATCRITKTTWKSIKSLWFQIVFLGYTLLRQQLKLYFNLSCLAVSNNQLEFQVMWTSLLRCLHSMSFKITHPLKQVRLRLFFVWLHGLTKGELQDQFQAACNVSYTSTAHTCKAVR